jgi:hypothetical protein
LRESKPISIWPFDGPLEQLLCPGSIVVAETYPAECYGWFFKSRLKSKGKVEHRKKVSSDLLDWSASVGLNLEADLICSVEAGFPQGDDAFDALVACRGESVTADATRKTNKNNCTNGASYLGPFFSQNRVLTNSLRQATSGSLWNVGGGCRPTRSR